MANLIRIDGTLVHLTPENQQYFTLEEMQTCVGGYIEMIRLDKDNYMVVNEEGSFLNLPKNTTATTILSTASGYEVVPVVGHALIVSLAELGDYYV